MMMLVFGWIIKKWSEAQQKQKERRMKEKEMLQWRRNTLSKLIVKMKKIAFLKWKREWNEEKIEIDACIFSTASLLLQKVTILFRRWNFLLQFFSSLHFLFHQVFLSSQNITFNFSFLFRLRFMLQHDANIRGRFPAVGKKKKIHGNGNIYARLLSVSFQHVPSDRESMYRDDVVLMYGFD